MLITLPRPMLKACRERGRCRCAQVRAFLWAGNDEGQSLVEFALCLPVLMIIVTGVLSYGIAINNFMLLTDATNVASRQLAISRGQTTDPCALTSAAVYAAAPTMKQASFSLTLVLNGTTYTGNSCSSSSTTSGAAGNLVQGSTAKLTATYPCSLALYGINYVSNCMMAAQTAELVQ